ncbi:RusA family crossover junction endodeoxyribonuclease [Idiomarina sp.]|uniref:RusA family crossover junction endodeoxyribonuclease n=1 Tax=Idiomarina sp. TaxID=1874361 RepID=UPI0025B9B417|nr:RusA family crossover junction endodeoxyribonuclease [Idiomarina sp.]
MTPLKLTLAFPPSVNTYWRNIIWRGKPRTLISKKGRAYREEVIWQCRAQRACIGLSQPLAVNITLNPPSNHRRDIDNYNKALLDALTHAHVITDDNLIKRLTVEFGPVTKPGNARVIIEPY